MATSSPLLKRPQQEQQVIHHHHHHHHHENDYVSPTYKSTPLFKPEISPYDEPSHGQRSRNVWGTHIHQYAGIGPLSFLGSSAKTRDLYVARSHRHFLSGLSYVRHDQINKTHITPFKKSLNRANDDLVPPAALIPLEKYDRIREDTQLVKEDKYASHQEKSDLFPQRSTTTKLPRQTAHEIRNLLAKTYGQTSYSESFYDQRADTTLTLGPQFQFYPSEDEEEEEKPEEECGENVKVETTEQVSDSDSEALEPLEDLQKEAQEAKNDPERPFWPAWPGNLSNQIDQVTNKITEKPDVCCKQDINDVRMIPVTVAKQHKDYKLLPDLNPAEQLNNRSLTPNLAPAKVNFAYSGHETTYGGNAERAQQATDKPIEEMPGCSRYQPVPSLVEDNIDEILARNRGAMYYGFPQPSPSREAIIAANDGRPKSGNSATRLPQIQESSSLEELRNTINGLQEPTANMQLPPLWESLTYSGDRVVDRLGVRFKSKAQQRYHQQHPHRIPVSLQEYLRDKVTCYKHPCRRRQYFYKDGYHMGSMFR